MKWHLYPLAFLFAIVLFYSEHTYGQISISPSVREFTSAGGGGYILTTGTGDWQAFTAEKWIKISPRTNGEAAQPCIYVVRNNSSPEGRDGAVILNGISHKVIQYGADAQLADYAAPIPLITNTSAALSAESKSQQLQSRKSINAAVNGFSSDFQPADIRTSKVESLAMLQSPGEYKPILNALQSGNYEMIRNACRTIQEQELYSQEELLRKIRSILNDYAKNPDPSHVAVDAIAWACKVAGASRHPEFREALSKLVAARVHRKASTHARSALAQLDPMRRDAPRWGDSAGDGLDQGKISSDATERPSEGGDLEMIPLPSPKVRSEATVVAYGREESMTRLPHTFQNGPNGSGVALERKRLRLSGGIGAQMGAQVWETGGRSQTANGKVEYLHFPISRLEFPLNLAMANFGISYNLTKSLNVSASASKSITSDAGKTKDSDWGVYYLQGNPRTYRSTLDIYSESDTDLDSTAVGIRISYTALSTRIFDLAAVLGYAYQKHDFEISSLRQQYPSSWRYFGRNTPADYQRGKVAEYDIAYSMPYAQVMGTFKINRQIIIRLGAGGSPWVEGSDSGNWILRSKTFESKDSGTMVMGFVQGRYDFNKTAFAQLTVEGMKVLVEAEQRQYFSGQYFGKIKQETELNQVSANLSLGIRF